MDQRKQLKLTTSEVKRRVRETHGKAIRLREAYAGSAHKHLFACNKGHEWTARVQNVTNGSGCPECARTQRGASISAGHANSEVRKTKFARQLATLERKYDLLFLDAGPIAATTRYRFECVPCGHQFTNTIRGVQTSVYGCPECGEDARIRNSTTPEAIEARRKQVIASTAAMRIRVLELSLGRTRLISKWRGNTRPRRYECNLCEHRWVVDYTYNSLKTRLLCPQCTKPTGVSAIATRWLEEEAAKRGIRIRHHHNGGEYIIPGTRFRVDGYHARSKTVFEFYGDRFHGNPRLYAPRTKPHPFQPYVEARTLYRRTKAREQQLRELGYTVVTVWEHDYKRRALRQLRARVTL